MSLMSEQASSIWIVGIWIADGVVDIDEVAAAAAGVADCLFMFPIAAAAAIAALWFQADLQMSNLA